MMPDPSYRRLCNFVLPVPACGLPGGVSSTDFLAPLQAGDWERAIAFYRRLMEDSASPEAALDNALACAFFRRGDDEEALHLIGSLVAREPAHPAWLNNLAVVSVLQGDYGPARGLLTRAAALAADDVVAGEISCNRACLEHLSGNWDEARLLLRRVLERQPGNIRALYLRARFAKELNRLDEAEECCRRLVALVPEEPEYRQNLGFVLLKKGKWEEGLELFETRWQTGGRRLPHPGQLWRGESLVGKTLLVWAEQGLGDTLNFARFIPLLLPPASGRLVIAVQDSLRGLFETSFPGGEVISLAEREAVDFDFHLPLMSLPRLFRVRPERVIGSCPYLRVAASVREAWRKRLAADGGAGGRQPRIGLVWNGNPKNAMDRGRSIPAREIAPLLQLPGIDYVVLLKEPRPEDLQLLRGLPPVSRDRIAVFSSELESFQDTAAILQGVDLLISVDTSVPHLAGALGVPTWLMLAFDADWRWLTEREDTVWYPSLRLFCQPCPGDWESVLVRIRDELREMAGGRSGLPQGAGRSISER